MTANRASARGVMTRPSTSPSTSTFCRVPSARPSRRVERPGPRLDGATDTASDASGETASAATSANDPNATTAGGAVSDGIVIGGVAAHPEALAPSAASRVAEAAFAITGL